MNSPLSLETTVCRNESVLSAEVDESLVLMSVDRGCYYSLDTVGSDIWQRLDGRVTVSDLCEALAEEYDAPLDVIRHDVLALLERLATDGLIDVAN
jgi:hypothetical protein